MTINLKVQPHWWMGSARKTAEATLAKYVPLRCDDPSVQGCKRCNKVAQAKFMIKALDMIIEQDAKIDDLKVQLDAARLGCTVLKEVQPMLGSS